MSRLSLMFPPHRYLHLRVVHAVGRFPSASLITAEIDLKKWTQKEYA